MTIHHLSLPPPPSSSSLLPSFHQMEWLHVSINFFISSVSSFFHHPFAIQSNPLQIFQLFLYFLVLFCCFSSIKSTYGLPLFRLPYPSPSSVYSNPISEITISGILPNVFVFTHSCRGDTRRTFKFSHSYLDRQRPKWGDWDSVDRCVLYEEHCCLDNESFMVSIIPSSFPQVEKEKRKGGGRNLISSLLSLSFDHFSLQFHRPFHSSSLIVHFINWVI